MKVIVIRTPSIDCISIEMDNTNLKYKLMDMMKEFILQRYYWRSKIDSSIIEYIEPKIFDAYIFCVDFYGNADDMMPIVQKFNEDKEYLETLEKSLYNPLTQDEIKKLALKIITLN